MTRGSHKNNRKTFRPFKKKEDRPHIDRRTQQRFKNKRKGINNGGSSDEEVKRQKLPKPQPVVNNSSSESEGETETPVQQLLSTFSVKGTRQKDVAIETDESDSSDEEENPELETRAENSPGEKSSVQKHKKEQTVRSKKEVLSDDSENDEDVEEDDKEEEDEDEENSEDAEISELDEASKEVENSESGESEKAENPKSNVDSEEEENPEEEGETIVSNATDPFIEHLNFDLSENLLDSLQNTHKKQVQNINWPLLGKLTFSIPTCQEVSVKKSSFSLAENKQYAPLGRIPSRLTPEDVNLDGLCVKSQIQKNIKLANKELDEDSDGEFLTELQCELFSIINNYQDLYYTERTFENSEEIRFVYCLHAINHVLKTRLRVLHHNAKLSKKVEVPEEFRDQGLVRPKVLIILPFRDSALKVVQMLIDILVPNEAGQVINKNRFMDEFTGGELLLPKFNRKPEDYELTFTGNCDDTFKMGIKITKKTLKLYADFYSSDIIVASPLGLRLLIGAAGDPSRDFDFLSSIELLILDQTELFLMQNWDHLLHLFNHLHVQPRDGHGTDFSRVRTWALNGLALYYRQTLIFSSLPLPEINAVFNRRCKNFAGGARVNNPVRRGEIVSVRVQVPQVFRRFEAGSAAGGIEKRFEFFVGRVLPQYRDAIMKNCLVYVPSYFDFVRLRNYFKREDVKFVQICEYTKENKITRARDMFYHGDAHFLLYSERFHHFRRIRIKGIRHIIFYQPPTFPHFYTEMCNFMQEANQNKKSGSMSNMTVTVMYSKYDSLQVAAIVGNERLQRIAASTNNFHMFTSSDN